MSKIEKTFYFLSGLPRSGSTVLAALLNQNPSVYVTPTSPMLDQLIANQDVWKNLQKVGLCDEQVQLDNITRQLINAAYRHVPQPIIIDKNRGWGKNMPASTVLFEKKIKIIATTRDLPSIMASWLSLLRTNPDSKMDLLLKQKGLYANDENRLDEMWHNMVKDCVESLQQAKKDAGDRLFLVNYDEIVEAPLLVLKNIEIFLNLPPWNYDVNNIINTTIDDDLSAWGLKGMHTIRSRLSKTSQSPESILGSSLYKKFQEIESKINGIYT